jgi:hypothetical protein
MITAAPDLLAEALDGEGAGGALDLREQQACGGFHTNID